MIITKFFNEFKPLIYAIIILSIFLIKELGWLPSGAESAVVMSVIVFFIIAAGIFIEFFLKRNKSKLKNTLKKLTNDLVRRRREAVLVIRNAPFSDIALKEGFTAAIRLKDVWDWSYVGVHPDCSKTCEELFKELEQVYLNPDKLCEIQTSALTYLPDYPFNEESLIFMGDIKLPEGQYGPENFPDHIWDIENKRGCEIEFHKLYLIKTHWKADKGNCTIRKIDLELDPIEINKKWNSVCEKMEMKTIRAQSIVYKDSGPEDKQKANFFAKLEKTVCKICKEKLFVISPYAGGPISVLKKGFSNKKKGFLKKIIAKTFLFFGWLLSPLSFYNDGYINVPLALLISYPFIHFFKWNMIWVVGFAYILTNLFGFILIYLGLYLGAKKPIWRILPVRTLLSLVIFSIVSIIAGKIIFV
ncbi:MAG: hypothetical protein FVQ80_07720 [Planctomycetes bacterium]|nr:hypothetical protein [Planctomycetota bacterium]